MDDIKRSRLVREYERNKKQSEQFLISAQKLEDRNVEIKKELRNNK